MPALSPPAPRRPGPSQLEPRGRPPTCQHLAPALVLLRLKQPPDCTPGWRPGPAGSAAGGGISSPRSLGEGRVLTRPNSLSAGLFTTDRPAPLQPREASAGHHDAHTGGGVTNGFLSDISSTSAGAVSQAGSVCTRTCVGGTVTHACTHCPFGENAPLGLLLPSLALPQKCPSEDLRNLIGAQGCDTLGSRVGKQEIQFFNYEESSLSLRHLISVLT